MYQNSVLGHMVLSMVLTQRHASTVRSHRVQAEGFRVWGFRIKGVNFMCGSGLVDFDQPCCCGRLTPRFGDINSQHFGCE